MAFFIDESWEEEEEAAFDESWARHLGREGELPPDLLALSRGVQETWFAFDYRLDDDSRTIDRFHELAELTPGERPTPRRGAFERPPGSRTVAGPEGSGKTPLVEAILGAFDGPAIAVRCRRDDDLDESMTCWSSTRSSLLSRATRNSGATAKRAHRMPRPSRFAPRKRMAMDRHAAERMFEEITPIRSDEAVRTAGLGRLAHRTKSPPSSRTCTMIRRMPAPRRCSRASSVRSHKEADRHDGTVR